MNKPNNSTTDDRRERLIAELESTNMQLHQLRLKATRIQQQLADLKNKQASPPPKKSTLAISKPKPIAQDDNTLMHGVSD